VAVPVTASGRSWTTGEPQPLFKGPYLYQGDGSLGREYDVAPDGQRFLMLKPLHAADSPPRFVLVQNWIDELRREMATK
jgi:hypothetical protein